MYAPDLQCARAHEYKNTMNDRRRIYIGERLRLQSRKTEKE